MAKKIPVSKSLIVYSLLAFVFLIAFYFVSLTQIIVDVQDIYTSKVFIEAKNNREFNEFLAIQIPKYKLNSISEKEDFTFYFYDGYGDEDTKIVVIIIIPNNNGIKIAESLEDLDDKTNLKIKVDNNNVIFDPLSSNKALSYGYNDDKVGFMFFDIIVNDHNTLNVTYFDYDGNEIISNDITVSQDSFNNESYINGYTTEELKNNMELDKTLKSKMIFRITISLVVIILLPYVYKLIKRLVLKK